MKYVLFRLHLPVAHRQYYISEILMEQYIYHRTTDIDIHFHEYWTLHVVDNYHFLCPPCGGREHPDYMSSWCRPHHVNFLLPVGGTMTTLLICCIQYMCYDTAWQLDKLLPDITTLETVVHCPQV